MLINKNVEGLFAKFQERKVLQGRDNSDNWNVNFTWIHMFLHIVQICFDCSNIICGIGPSTVNDERLAKTGETEMDQSGERMPKYTNTFSMISYPYFTIPYHNLPHQNHYITYRHINLFKLYINVRTLAYVLLSLMPTRPIPRHHGKCMNLVKLNHSVTEC